MEYNTQREKITITDYGRNVNKLIEWAKGLPTREQRNEAAAGIIEVMTMVNPKVKEQGDYEKMLWEHLMIMSHWELDVDVPYDLQREESLSFQPKRIELKNTPVNKRHYGRIIEDMAKKLQTVEEGEGREVLTADLARRMKFSYLNWNYNIVENSLIEEDLSKMVSREVHVEESAMKLSPELEAAVGTMKEDELSPKKKKKK